MAVDWSDVPPRRSGRAMSLVEELGPKTSKHLLHVARYGYGEGGAGGVECNVHPEVLVAVRADGDLVVIEVQCFFQVVDVGL